MPKEKARVLRADHEWGGGQRAGADHSRYRPELAGLAGRPVAPAH